MQPVNIKATAHEFIEQLPDDISWTDLACHVEVRASVERGLEDVKVGRVYTTTEVRKQLGLSN